MFFALWPDAPARAALGELAAGIVRNAGGRAPAEANLHLTLMDQFGVHWDRIGDSTGRVDAQLLRMG